MWYLYLSKHTNVFIYMYNHTHIYKCSCWICMQECIYIQYLPPITPSAQPLLFVMYIKILNVWMIKTSCFFFPQGGIHRHFWLRRPAAVFTLGSLLNCVFLLEVFLQNSVHFSVFFPTISITYSTILSLPANATRFPSTQDWVILKQTFFNWRVPSVLLWDQHPIMMARDVIHWTDLAVRVLCVTHCNR